LQRALVQVDPAGAGPRAVAAEKRRRVNAVRPVGEGLGSFSAVLAAPCASALEQACERAAKASRAAGDERTLEQLRADALGTMAEHALLTGQIGAPGITTETFVFTPSQVRIIASPASRRTDGPSLADTIHWDINPDTTCTPSARRAVGTVSAPAAGDAAPVGSSATPAPGAPSVPASPTSDGSTPSTSFLAATDDEHTEGCADCPRPSGREDRRDAAHLGDASGSGDALAGAPVPRIASSSVPGVDVPDLVGFGAVAPDTVTTHEGLSWVRIVEPPEPGGVAPPDAPGYHPTAELARYVRARDRTCAVPGCAVDAWRGDLDHIVPWPKGPTSAENLRPLCRRHHRLRTHAGFRLDTQPDGSTTWTTPFGTARLRDPDGHLTRTTRNSEPP
ncbi:MAG TPA: hypothetical protein DHV14_01600, partial [Micrococcales bacterium]|nr:hypothetical protein [Micrococcales bacterium]